MCTYFIRYACRWTRDCIEMYYDGRRVRKITDEKILAEMDKPQMVVINNHLNLTCQLVTVIF